MRFRRVADPREAVLAGSTPQELGLGRSELLVAQHAGGVELRQLLQLGRQIGPGCLRHRRRRRRSLLLLHRLELLLLVRLLLLHLFHVRLLLGSRLLPRVLLLLTVVNSARRPGDDRRCGGDAY
jgi:hypothetical protein